MTKNLILVAGLLLLGGLARGQTLVGAAGNTVRNSSLILEYAVGEPAVITLQPNGSMPVLQGLLQPTKNDPFVVADANDLFDAKYGFRCFPNPALDAVTVETSFPDFATYRVVGLDGQLVAEGQFEYAPLPVRAWPPGAYFVRLASADQTITKTFKIIKT